MKTKPADHFEYPIIKMGYVQRTMTTEHTYKGSMLVLFWILYAATMIIFACGLG